MKTIFNSRSPVPNCFTFNLLTIMPIRLALLTVFITA